MAQMGAMSDDQVASELKKMTAFIRQEALEKAQEIEIRADQEFAAEKAKLVRQEMSAIDTNYDKKFKQASMSQQITKSTLSNKIRLRLLGARQELLDDLFEQVRGKLKEASGSGGDKAKYQEVLKNLILQGVYALNEPKMLVRARKEDYDVVKKAADDAKKEYKEKTNKDITIEIDEKNPHPDDISGGVSIVGGGGKIDVNNTLEERVKLLETEALPSIRSSLFGDNENRRFRD